MHCESWTHRQSLIPEAIESDAIRYPSLLTYDHLLFSLDSALYYTLLMIRYSTTATLVLFEYLRQRLGNPTRPYLRFGGIHGCGWQPAIPQGRWEYLQVITH